jgi:hypothetical protein
VNAVDKVGLNGHYRVDGLVAAGVSSMTSASLRHSSPAVMRLWCSALKQDTRHFDNLRSRPGFKELIIGAK